MAETPQTDWRNLYPGLYTDPPRRTRLGPGPIAMLCLSAVFFLLGALAFWSCVQEVINARSLLEHGIRADAVVNSHIRHYGKNNYFMLTFTYGANGMHGSQTVDEDTYYRTHDGDKIPIIYIANRPEDCKTAGQLHGVIDYDIKLGLFLIGAFGSLGAGCAAISRRIGSRERILARSGILVDATITDLDGMPEANARPQHVDVRFEFEVDGTRYSGSQSLYSPICASWKSGITVPALYNAENPDDSVIYPAITDSVRV